MPRGGEDFTFGAGINNYRISWKSIAKTCFRSARCAPNSRLHGPAASKPDLLRQPPDAGACRARTHVEEGWRRSLHPLSRSRGADGNFDRGHRHAAITATILALPMGYVRSGSKDHGRGNQIEAARKGQKVVVVEDLIDPAVRVSVVTALQKPAPRCWAWRRSSPTAA